MNFRFWLSGLVAFIAEICCIAILFWALLPKMQKQYTFQDKTVLDFVEIDQILSESKKRETKKAIATQKSLPKTVQKEEKVIVKSSHQVGSDVRKLFEKVDSSNPPVRDENIEDERPKFSANAMRTQKYSYSKDDLQIQQESSKIRDALDSLWEKELEVNVPEMADLSEGEYDEWFAEIKKILYAKWVNRFYESVAITVSLNIAADGSWTYRMIKMSKNEAYNIYMDNFLNELKKEKFPPYPKGKIKLEITFKTKEQNE